MGDPIDLVLSRSSEHFPWMFRGRICCLGFAWDRSTTLTVASQELSQNSFSSSSSRKGLWSMASMGKLSLMLRVSKSADMGMEPCGRVASPRQTQLCYKSVLHTHREQAALSWYCNPCLAAMVRITGSKVFPSRCSSQCECVLATSSKPESQPQGGWERVTQRSEGRRHKLESGADEKRAHEQAGAPECIQPSVEGAGCGS